jgi:hypothetical protein
LLRITFTVILRCERSEPRRMHGPGRRPSEIGFTRFRVKVSKSATADLDGPLRGHLRVTENWP